VKHELWNSLSPVPTKAKRKRNKRAEDLRESFMPEALGRPEETGLPYSGIQGNLYPVLKHRKASALTQRH